MTSDHKTPSQRGDYNVQAGVIMRASNLIQSCTNPCITCWTFFRSGLGGGIPGSCVEMFWGCEPQKQPAACTEELHPVSSPRQTILDQEVDCCGEPLRFQGLWFGQYGQAHSHQYEGVVSAAGTLQAYVLFPGLRLI